MNVRRLLRASNVSSLLITFVTTQGPYRETLTSNLYRFKMKARLDREFYLKLAEDPALPGEILASLNC